MRFEFDPKKSASNKAKHGLDFEEAKSLWDDPNRIEFDAKITDEPRRMMIASLGEKLWVAVFTLRGDNIRLISVRRARDYEVERYEDD